MHFYFVVVGRILISLPSSFGSFLGVSASKCNQPRRTCPHVVHHFLPRVRSSLLNFSPASTSLTFAVSLFASSILKAFNSQASSRGILYPTTPASPCSSFRWVQRSQPHGAKPSNLLTTRCLQHHSPAMEHAAYLHRANPSSSPSLLALAALVAWLPKLAHSIRETPGMQHQHRNQGRVS